jgi:hypothetical protein
MYGSDAYFLSLHAKKNQKEPKSSNFTGKFWTLIAAYILDNRCSTLKDPPCLVDTLQNLGLILLP